MMLNDKQINECYKDWKTYNKQEKEEGDQLDNPLNVISLFSGTGGADLAFQQEGFNIVFANDFDKYCQQTYNANFNHELFFGDITQIESSNIPNGDVVVGTFPCQAFSIAGKQLGFEDSRGTLFYEIARIIKDKQPKAFLLENVKNLTSHDNGRTFEVICNTFKELGYYLDYKILNTADYVDIPQHRERVFIVGFKEQNQLEQFQFPNPVPATKNIWDFIDKTIKEADNLYYENTQYYEDLNEAMVNPNTTYQLRRGNIIRENKSNQVPTITANFGTGGHNVPLIRDNFGIRKLSPRECFRFQGFPEDFKLVCSNTQLYKQAGNAVTVPLVRLLAKEIKRILQQSYDI